MFKSPRAPERPTEARPVPSSVGQQAAGKQPVVQNCAFSQVQVSGFPLRSDRGSVLSPGVLAAIARCAGHSGSWKHLQTAPAAPPDEVPAPAPGQRPRPRAGALGAGKTFNPHPWKRKAYRWRAARRRSARGATVLHRAAAAGGSLLPKQRLAGKIMTTGQPT